MGMERLIIADRITNGQRLKEILINNGLATNVCKICGQLPEWNGRPLTLELDHINGDRMDNRPENLRIICPHCHTQTDTYKSKNSKTVKRYKVSTTVKMSL